MSPISRRIFRYWLLLLLPTLMVGGGAILLLRREQGRLMEQSANVDESRRAALTARTRLIAENVELLVGDVQDGLLDTIGAEPTASFDAFMDRWQRGNPLVRIAFRADLDGRLLRPVANTTDEDARGFVRRYPRLLGENPPWLTTASPEKSRQVEPQTKLQLEEKDSRKEVASNVAQVQSARRDVQQLFKVPYDSPSFAQTPAPAASGGLADSAGANARNLKKAETDQLAAVPSDERRSAANAVSSPKVARNDPRADKADGMAEPRAKDASSGRRGWVSATLDGRQHLVGWIQAATAEEVRGVELEMAALISRLGGTLPAEMGAGEGYALRDEQARVVHQVGTVPRGALAASRVPLAASLLPGWEVVGFLSTNSSDGTVGAGFLWIGILLVGIFVAAILAGGSLLLWQARRSEEEATQKTSFVANVSHEFKTPLTTIRLYSELLEQGRVRDPAQGGDYLRTIGRETQRLARLVNNALDFSRLEQGKKKYAREPLDLTAELARMLDTHAPRIAEAGLALHRELPPASLSVTTDRDALEQIVLNLIDNAAKYAAEGGEVTVSAGAKAGGGAEVRVADRGPGVPLEHREMIFEKFHRVDDALTAEKSGAGLGLSIARQLARGLGGELRFKARAGGGAEFILELP